MTQVIPLTPGTVNAHQIESIQLGDHFLEIRINWNTRFSYWYADIYENGSPILISSTFNSLVDLLKNLNASGEYGQLVFLGDDATLTNLGRSNSLTWIAPNG